MTPLRYIPAFVLSLLIPFSALAKRQKTTIPGKLTPAIPIETVQTTAPCDTLIASSDCDLREMIQLAGYDKPISASRETLHISNLSTERTLVGVRLSIVYLDRQGRQLHSRDVDIETDVPPGETRIVSFPTWDPQRSFYYKDSVKPRRIATPYTIRVTPLWLIFKNQNVPTE